MSDSKYTVELLIILCRLVIDTHNYVDLKKYSKLIDDVEMDWMHDTNE